MELLTGQEAQNYVDGFIHAKTQVGVLWLDLTVSKIERVKKRGSLDFGGSEFAAASTLQLHPHKQQEEDRYGWWELGDGMYLITFNERLKNLPKDHTAFLSPHPRLIAAGASHTAGYFYSEDKLGAVLTVPLAGCALKQNCRLSRLQVFKNSPASG